MCAKFLGLDYGDKTIGVSLSPNGITAVGLTTLTRTDENALRANLKALKEIIKEHDITHIVLGYPLSLNGAESMRCQKTLDFKNKLNRYFKSIPVELWDERLSTAAVTRTFSGGNYKAKVDEMAAIYILQGYLDRRINMDQENKIVLFDEDENEITLQVLSSRKLNDVDYLLAVEDSEDDEAEVMHFKLIDDGEETIFEMVDDESEEMDAIMELFKDDYAELGIDLEDEGV